MWRPLRCLSFRKDECKKMINVGVNLRPFHFERKPWNKNFCIRVCFHGHLPCTEQQGKGEDHLYSFLPLPPNHEHSAIYLRFCIWDDYHVFLIALQVVTRLLLSEIYHRSEFAFNYWLIVASAFTWWFNTRS